MNLKPLFDNVILKTIKEETVTDFGLILPSNSNDSQKLAEVVAVGCKVEENLIMLGDKVLFSKYAGIDFKNSGQELILIKQDDIIAKII